MSNTAEGDGKDVKDETANEASRQPIFAIPQPIREDQVQNAVKFLSHPRVRVSPIIHRRSFLERKGLTKEEIDEAFRRVPVRLFLSFILVPLEFFVHLNILQLPFFRLVRHSFMEACYNVFHRFYVSYVLQDPPPNATSAESTTTNQGNLFEPGALFCN